MTFVRIYNLSLTVMLAFGVFVLVVAVSPAVGEGAGKLVTVKGTIKSIDASKGEMIFVPQKSVDEMLIKVPDRDLLKGWKNDDKVKLTYRQGKQNIADRISDIKQITLPVGCGSH